MTSQTYHTDDHQLVQEHHPVVPDSDLMEPGADSAEADAEVAVAEPELAEPDAYLAEPDADMVVAEPDLAEPDADMAVAEPELAEPDADLAEPDADMVVAEPDLAEPDADMVVAEPDLAEPDADLAEADAEVAVAEPDLAEPDAESAAFTMPDYLGFTPAGDHDPAATATADSSNGSSSLVSVAYTVPESVTESQPAGNTASTHGPWNEIQAMFVDDPRASIERAAGLVDDRVEAHILSLREQQSSMRSPWQAGDAGTEELRVALQHYRTFWNGLEDLPE